MAIVPLNSTVRKYRWNLSYKCREVLYLTDSLLFLFFSLLFSSLFSAGVDVTCFRGEVDDDPKNGGGVTGFVQQQLRKHGFESNSAGGGIAGSGVGRGARAGAGAAGGGAGGGAGGAACTKLVLEPPLLSRHPLYAGSTLLNGWFVNER